eukprot:5631073-Amphidinium_carterae.1
MAPKIALVTDHNDGATYSARSMRCASCWPKCCGVFNCTAPQLDDMARAHTYVLHMGLLGHDLHA